MVEAELSFTQSIEDLTGVRSDTLFLKYTSDRSTKLLKQELAIITINVPVIYFFAKFSNVKPLSHCTRIPPCPQIDVGLFGTAKGSTCHPGSINPAIDLGNLQLSRLTCDVKSVPRCSTKLPRRRCTCLSRSDFMAGLSCCQQAVILEAPGLRELLTQISKQNKVLARSHEISSPIDLNQDPSLRIFFLFF